MGRPERLLGTGGSSTIYSSTRAPGEPSFQPCFDLQLPQPLSSTSVISLVVSDIVFCLQTCPDRVTLPTRRPRPRGTSPPSVPAVPSAASQTQTRTGPRSRIWQRGGASRIVLPSGTTVGSSLPLGQHSTDPQPRQEAQETPGRSREARRIIIGLSPSDARRDPTDGPAGRESPTLQEKPRDSIATALAQIAT